MVWVSGAHTKGHLWQGYTRQKHRSGKATREHKEQQLPCWEKKNQTGRVFPFQSQHVCLFSAPGSVRLLKNWKLPCTGKDTLWTKGKLEIFHIIFFSGHWAEVLTSKNGLLTHIRVRVCFSPFLSCVDLWKKNAEDYSVTAVTGSSLWRPSVGHWATKKFWIIFLDLSWHNYFFLLFPSVFIFIHSCL